MGLLRYATTIEQAQVWASHLNRHARFMAHVQPHWADASCFSGPRQRMDCAVRVGNNKMCLACRWSSRVVGQENDLSPILILFLMPSTLGFSHNALKQKYPLVLFFFLFLNYLMYFVAWYTNTHHIDIVTIVFTLKNTFWMTTFIQQLNAVPSDCCGLPCTNAVLSQGDTTVGCRSGPPTVTVELIEVSVATVWATQSCFWLGPKDYLRIF